MSWWLCVELANANTLSLDVLQERSASFFLRRCQSRNEWMEDSFRLTKLLFMHWTGGKKICLYICGVVAPCDIIIWKNGICFTCNKIRDCDRSSSLPEKVCFFFPTWLTTRNEQDPAIVVVTLIKQLKWSSGLRIFINDSLLQVA